MTASASRLVDVVTRVLVDEGFEGISVRKVADRAGVSIGAVQHHFPTKDAMLTAAMDRAAEQFQAGIEAQWSGKPSATEALRAVSVGLLAADERARTGSVLWIARLARAAVHPPTAAVHAREWGRIAALLEDLVSCAVPGLDGSTVADEAATLLALTDGLAVAVLREPDRMSPERAVRLVETHLDALLAR